MFVLVSPEAAIREDAQPLLERATLLVLDEVHCASDENLV